LAKIISQLSIAGLLQTSRGARGGVMLATRPEEITLLEAAQSIVPIARSAPEQVQSIRQLAHNKFLSGSYPGFYKMPAAPERKASGRVMDV